jgi:hypothetical protein
MALAPEPNFGGTLEITHQFGVAGHADLAGPAALEHDAVPIHMGCSPSIGRLRYDSIVA